MPSLEERLAVLSPHLYDAVPLNVTVTCQPTCPIASLSVHSCRGFVQRPLANAHTLGVRLGRCEPKKKDAVQQLAPLADALDDIEARIAELLTRTKNLERG